MSRCRDLSSLTINSDCRTDTRPFKCRIPGHYPMWGPFCHACMLASPTTHPRLYSPTTVNECISVCSSMAAQQSRVFVRAAHPDDPGVAYLPSCPPTSHPRSPATSRHPLPCLPDMHICSLERAAAPLWPAAHRLLNSQPLPAATLRFPVS